MLSVLKDFWTPLQSSVCASLPLMIFAIVSDLSTPFSTGITMTIAPISLKILFVKLGYSIKDNKVNGILAIIAKIISENSNNRIRIGY